MMLLAEFFRSSIVLENENIILRPLKKSDIQGLDAISYTEGLFEYGQKVKQRQDLEEYLVFCEEARKSLFLYPFIIISKPSFIAAGVTMLGEISFENQRAEIGWTWLGLNFQGTGLNTQCKVLLLNYVFETLNFRRVQFKADILNVRSQKAIEKLGAIQEGILRNYSVMGYGKSSGTVVYSILKEEWKHK